MSHSVIFAGHSRVEFSSKPAGAYVIANVLRKYGFTATVIDLVFSLPKEELHALIDKFVTSTTRFICLSTTLLGPVNLDAGTLEDCEAEFKPIMEYCQTRAPQATWIIGGSKIGKHDPTTLPFHYAVIGQGESTLTAIINHELYDDPLQVLEEINGVKYVSDRTYGFDEFNTSQELTFTAQDGVAPGEVLPLEYGRGCVFKCSYCSYDLTGKSFGDFTKTEEALYSSLMNNYELFGTTKYTLTDDTINDSLEKALGLQRVVDRLPFKIEFGGYMRLELFQKHPEMVEIYRAAGLKAVNFGIETFNKKAGAAVGKGFGEKAKDVLEQLKQVWGDDVEITGNFILGLPHDTFQDLEAQQLWLESSPVFTNLFYSTLVISKSQGLQGFEDYYTDLPITPELQIYLDKHSQVRQFFKTYLNWGSPEMNRAQADALRRSYTDRFIRSRGNKLSAQLSAFNLMVLSRYHPLDELKTFLLKDYSTIMSSIRRRRIDEYLELMKQATNIELPLPERQTPLLLKDTGVFQPKRMRVIPIKHAPH